MTEVQAQNSTVPYADQYMSAQTVSVFKPEVGGYLFRSQYGELLYMSKTAFEAKYTSASGSVTNAEDGG
ncbi:hypothetical protein WI249_16070 [Salmonella enterica subsp. enterica serovar Infantis]